MNKTTLLLIFIFLQTSCSKDSSINDFELDKPINITNPILVEDCDPHVLSDCDEDPNGINIRIRNLSLFEICNIEYTTGDKYNYGSLLPGESTCYITVSGAYRYPSGLNYQYQDKTVTSIAFDFLGESLLEPGYYTYNVSKVETVSGATSTGSMTAKYDDKIMVNQSSEMCEENNKSNCDISQSQVNLRIVNNSIFVICNYIYTNNNKNSVNFGTLQPGDTSCYIPIQSLTELTNRMQFEIDGVSFDQNLTYSSSNLPSITSGKYMLNFSLQNLLGEIPLYGLIKED